MSIKLDTIYNYGGGGGGGGGYKDGGELVDADFIEVKNNTASTYDNTARDPVNFYFEAKDGEIINSIIELTTTINAMVNVYVVKNGIYYLLGNIGGNTVNAGDYYKINISGNSFKIENVSNSLIPEYVNINGLIVPVYQVENKLFITGDIKGGNFRSGEYWDLSHAVNFVNSLGSKYSFLEYDTVMKIASFTPNIKTKFEYSFKGYFNHVSNQIDYEGLMYWGWGINQNNMKRPYILSSPNADLNNWSGNMDLDGMSLRVQFNI